MSGASGVLAGKVAVVTGSGGAIGAGYAKALANAGAAVVVNDLGVDLFGAHEGTPPRAGEVVSEIHAAGGQAVLSSHDIASWEGSSGLLALTLETYGRADFLINNAGIIRDRVLVNMTEQDWDDVIRVHMKGTFCPTHHFAVHWRGLTKAGEKVDARILNTTSAAGLYGNIGQVNYGSAKAAVAAFSIIASAELGQYGVAVNAIRPTAMTRMTAGIDPGTDKSLGVLPASPAAFTEFVVWLFSEAARGVSGRVFEVAGGRIGVAQGWRHGPEARSEKDWTFESVAAAMPGLLFGAAEPVPVLGLRP
jgi:NAD(P)-dependent dehydrogenase (short-subunit alcohol dehydrogenase family)